MGEVIEFDDLAHRSFVKAVTGYSDLHQDPAVRQEAGELAWEVSRRNVELRHCMRAPEHKEVEAQREFDALKGAIELDLMADRES